MTDNRANRWVVACVALLGTMVASTDVSHAQPTPENKAIAESLFRDGRALMDQGRIPEACRKLEESQKLDPALGTLLNMAVCHEKEGKIATAWAEFNEAMVQARREGRQDRYDLAAQHVQGIEPNLPRLTIQVPPNSRLPGLEILRNDTPLGSGAWNTALPVDPGDVKIEARAPKYKPWSTTIPIAFKETKAVEVPVLELAPEPPKPPPGIAPPPTSTAPPRPREWWNGNRVAGVTVGGIGLAAMAVGGVFGYNALNKNSQAKDYCSGTTCSDQRGVDLSDDARSSARIADITVGAGALAVAVGAILIFTGGSDEAAPGADSSARRRGLDVSLTVAPSAAGAGVRGTW